MVGELQRRFIGKRVAYSIRGIPGTILLDRVPHTVKTFQSAKPGPGTSSAGSVTAFRFGWYGQPNDPITTTPRFGIGPAVTRPNNPDLGFGSCVSGMIVAGDYDAASPGARSTIKHGAVFKYFLEFLDDGWTWTLIDSEGLDAPDRGVQFVFIVALAQNACGRMRNHVEVVYPNGSMESSPVVTSTVNGMSRFVSNNDVGIVGGFARTPSDVEFVLGRPLTHPDLSIPPLPYTCLRDSSADASRGVVFLDLNIYAQNQNMLNIKNRLPLPPGVPQPDDVYVGPGGLGQGLCKPSVAALVQQAIGNEPWGVAGGGRYNPSDDAAGLPSALTPDALLASLYPGSPSTVELVSVQSEFGPLACSVGVPTQATSLSVVFRNHTDKSILVLAALSLAGVPGVVGGVDSYTQYVTLPPQSDGQVTLLRPVALKGALQIAGSFTSPQTGNTAFSNSCFFTAV